MSGPRVFVRSRGSDADPRDPPASPTSPRPGRWTDLLPRIVSAIVMVALALGTLVVGGLLFAAFWYAASLAIHWEWQRMVGGERAILRFLVGVIVLAGATYLALAASLDAALFVLVAGAAVLAWAAGAERRLWSAAGLFYAAALVMSVCMLRSSVFDGFEAVLWLFAVVWGTDVMAYFGGRVIGGAKLLPRVSPAKTWSGLLTGIVCGALIGVAVIKFTRLADVAVLPLLLLGVAVATISTCGDLAESAVKRHFGIKDASRLIPGHGGVMDRLDGFIAGSTFAALFGLARGVGATAVAHGLFHW